MIQINRPDHTTITIHDLAPLRVHGARYGIVINPETKAIGDYSGIGGGFPPEIHFERVLWVPARASMHTPSLIRALVNNMDLIADLMACYEGVEYDGSNTIGLWAERYMDLWELLRDSLSNVPDVFDPIEYIAGADPTDLMAYGETLTEMAEGLEAEALGMAVYMDSEALHTALIEYFRDHQIMLMEADGLEDWEIQLLARLNTLMDGEE